MPDSQNIAERVAEVEVAVSSLASSVQDVAETVRELTKDVKTLSREQAATEASKNSIPFGTLGILSTLLLGVMALYVSPLQDRTSVQERKIDELYNTTREWDGYIRRYIEETDRRVLENQIAINEMWKNPKSGEDDRQDAMLEDIIKRINASKTP
jgi:hypothetical protein